MIEFLQLPWVQLIVFGLVGVLLGLVVERVVVVRVHRLALRTSFRWDDLLVKSLRGLPTVWLGAAGLYLALAIGTVDPLVLRSVQGLLTIALFGSVTIGAMRLAGGAVEMLSTQTPGAIQSPTLVVNVARLAIGALGLFIILQNLGIQITPLLTALGIGGLAVALALQDTLGNLFSGVHIILAGQVRTKDFVRLSTGDEGWVTDVRARNTTIETFPDGNLLAVPNTVLASSIVKNFTFPRAHLWVSVDVGVSYSSDLEHVEAVTLEVAREVLADIEGGVSEEDPIMLYRAFGASSIDFQVRLMVRDFRSQGPVRHAFIKRLHRRYGVEGIQIPFPIRTVIMDDGEPRS
jgi:small-conductance mechanosensitive channel